MKRTSEPSYVMLDAIVTAMILGLLAVGLYNGQYSGLFEGGIVITGHLALAVWAHANVVEDESPGTLRLVRRDGAVTIYTWTPATGRLVNR